MSDNTIPASVDATEAMDPPPTGLVSTEVAWGEEPDEESPEDFAPKRINRSVIVVAALAAVALAVAVVAAVVVLVSPAPEPFTAVRPDPVEMTPPAVKRPGVRPMTVDERLLAAMKTHNIAVKKPQAAVEDAPIICENLSNGSTSWETEVNAVIQATPGYTQADADEYLRLVEQFYCPQAGQITADMTTDEKFLAALAANGVGVDQKAAAVDNAHKVCRNIQAGQNWEQVARDLREHAIGYTEANADTFVNVATQLYCPQH
jgi:Protein of unknown function (DUF732)